MSNAIPDVRPTKASVPPEIQSRIESGLRWTVWLAAATMPFSIITNTLLAWTGPEAIGTFGLLTVYIGFVTAFFYLGGDTVCIRFVPELAAQHRTAFVTSYFALICVCLVPWLIISYYWPGAIRYLLGDYGSDTFQMLVLSLSPIYIGYSLVSATLKGVLQIAWAQAMTRLLTVAFCGIYAVIFWSVPALVKAHYPEVIWSTYLGLAAVAGVFGVFRLRLFGGQRKLSILQWLLPPGFWRYMAATQALGILTFFMQRLDYILIVNAGGVATLGRYVMLMTVAGLIPVVNNIFRDNLLPSITNLLACRNLPGAADICAMHMRIVFLANTVLTCGLILMSDLMILLFGRSYSSLKPLMVLMVLIVGMSSPGSLGIVLLSSVGRQHRAVWIGLGQVVLTIGGFWVLWPRFGLLGAVLAYGSALLIANISLWFAAKASVPFSMAGTREYGWFAAVSIAAALVAAGPLSLGRFASAVASAAAVTVFLLAAKYDTAECLTIVDYFVPGSALFFRRRLDAIRC